MDAAGWAAQRNQQIADNALRAIQMLMQGKQYQQDRQWQQGQFDYRKEQDRINQDQQNRSLERQDQLARQQAAYQQAQAEHYARMDEDRLKPTQVKKSDFEVKFDKGLEIYGDPRKAAIYAQGKDPEEKPKPDKPDKPAQDERAVAAIRQKAKDEGWDQKTLNKAIYEYYNPPKTDKTPLSDKFYEQLIKSGIGEQDALFYTMNPEQYYTDYPPNKGGKSVAQYMTKDGKPVPAGAKTGTDAKTGKRVAKIGNDVVEIFPIK